MCAHKHFRRKVSKSPFFLIKVKNIYILATKLGTDYTDYTDVLQDYKYASDIRDLKSA